MATLKKTNSKRKRSGGKTSNGAVRRPLPFWLREVIGFALLGGTIVLFLSLFTYSPETDPGFFNPVISDTETVRNKIGPVGSYLASFLKETLGLGAYFVCALLAGTSYLVIWGRRPQMVPWKIPLGLCSLVWVSALLSGDELWVRVQKTKSNRWTAGAQRKAWPIQSSPGLGRSQQGRT